MEIRINGQIADIKTDTEKTIGEVMSALEPWFAASNHRLSGIEIDGERASSDSIEDFFSRNIDTVKVLELFCSSIAQLSLECILMIHADIEKYESLDFAQKRDFAENWEKSPQAQFASEQIPDILSLCREVFSGSVTPQMLSSIIEERIREFDDPAGELVKIEALVNEICSRLVDLPLDIQTGKDSRAAQTIQIFSGIAEKIIRVYFILPQSSSDSIKNMIKEFDISVKELLSSYEKHDTVIIGDIAEYEIAPKLQELYAAIISAFKEQL
jgi:hypothetical protein